MFRLPLPVNQVAVRFLLAILVIAAAASSGGGGGGSRVPSTTTPTYASATATTTATPSTTRRSLLDGASGTSRPALTIHAELAASPTSTPPESAVTIVTQSTLAELVSLEAMAASWTGPIVCALYAHSDEADEAVAAARAMAIAQARVKAGGTNHLKIIVVGEDSSGDEEDDDDDDDDDDDHKRWRRAVPMSSLRNVAATHAATDLIFCLDVVRFRFPCRSFFV